MHLHYWALQLAVAEVCIIASGCTMSPSFVTTTQKSRSALIQSDSALFLSLTKWYQRACCLNLLQFLLEPVLLVWICQLLASSYWISWWWSLIRIYTMNLKNCILWGLPLRQKWQKSVFTMCRSLFVEVYSCFMGHLVAWWCCLEYLYASLARNTSSGK